AKTAVASDLLPNAALAQGLHSRKSAARRSVIVAALHDNRATDLYQKSPVADDLVALITHFQFALKRFRRLNNPNTPRRDAGYGLHGNLLQMTQLPIIAASPTTTWRYDPMDKACGLIQIMGYQ